MTKRQSYYIGLKAIIESKGKILIIHETAKNKWELPGGRVDHNQGIEDPLERELTEEIQGIKDIQIKRVVYAAQGDFLVENDHKLFLLFFEISAQIPQKIVLSKEHTSFAWVGLKDLDKYEMFKSDRTATARYLSEASKNWGEL